MLVGSDCVIVENTATGEVLAVITDKEITTASDVIVVKMRFDNNGLSFSKNTNNKQYKPGNDGAKNRHTPIMQSVLSLLTNPAFFFGCLSGGFLSHFVLCPIILR